MTEFSATSINDTAVRDRAQPTREGTASRRWRSLWRIHFYSGMFAMPFIVLMALTGLVILYTQPLLRLTEGDLRSVSAGTVVQSYDTQAKAVEAAYPKAKLTALTVPGTRTESAIFAIDDGTANGRQVFVNPYTAKVLGSVKTSGGFVGLANRLHGFLNAKSVTIDLPSVGALWDSGAIMRPYVVGDLILEVLAVWTLVLVMSGLYLWWPRRSRTAAVTTGGPRRGLFRVRLKKRGRARWRDLHGMSGVLLIGAIGVTIVSGLGWSTYWGPNFTALANKISPNVWTDAPPSPVGRRGDLDRFGNQIPWNTADAPLPASLAIPATGTVPRPVGLDAIVKVAADEHMRPGYSIAFPPNIVDEKTKKTTYGSYTISNSWPRKTGEAENVYVDQFSGNTLASMGAYGYGAVSYGLDTLVSTHMGTQLGLSSRVMMTALCVLALWSVFSALKMFTKRRRPGTPGIPRRPVDVKLARRLTVTTWVMAVIFPVWGATAAIVLGLDRFLIRRNRRLRTAFGQR